MATTMKKYTGKNTNYLKNGKSYGVEVEKTIDTIKVHLAGTKYTVVYDEVIEYLSDWET